MTSPRELPIDGALPALLDAVRARGRLVLEAEPGAGKTTRVPWALVEAGLAGAGQVLVLEPRRIAARAAAAYVAASLGETVGERIGFQVRFESAVGPRTRVVYLTEALFVRRLRSDPALRGVGAVVLDEFHERHVAGDLALGLAQRAQEQRAGPGGAPPLALVVMSATLDGVRVAQALDAAHLRVAGRSFPVEIAYEEPAGATRPAARAGARRAENLSELAAQVARAVRRSAREEAEGHVLVFLPGAREIREAATALADFAREADLDMLPLHGELDAAAQDRVLAPSSRRKVVLATNVAETSLTIDGTACVVDSGLARMPSHDPWSGLPRLQLAKVSRASAAQRAGRAGRQRPGRCLRLYTRADHDARPEHDAPEVMRLDLAEALLDLHAAGIADPRSFAWLDPPPEVALRAAEQLLAALGALDPAHGVLSEIGRAMLRFPAHPRVARLLVEAERIGVAADAAGVAALLGERSIRRGPSPARSGTADVLADLHDLDATRADPHAARMLGLDANVCRQVERARRQILALVDRRARTAAPSGGALRESDALDAALRQCLLRAYPDRVARARGEAGERTWVLCNGGAAAAGRESVVHGAEWAVVVDAEERREPGGRGGLVRARSVAAIEPEWLLGLEPSRVEEQVRVTFDVTRERVVARAQIRYGELVLDDAALRTIPPEATALLREAALAAGPEAFAADADALRALVARARFAHALDARVPSLDDAQVRGTLARLCEGLSSFAELRDAGLYDAVRAALGTEGAALLEQLAPREVVLQGRRRARVHYAPGEPPWIASRLQDFFGASDGPRIGAGRVPLVLRLLAPNQRPVQITTDLAGFWRQHYPALRRALLRRYPRHAWPEDPLHP